MPLNNFVLHLKVRNERDEMKKRIPSAVKSKVKNKTKSSSSRCDSLQEYLLSSTLHGLRYIGTASLTIFERVFFTLSFFLVFLLSAYFISNIWQKWEETPVIIGLDPTATNIKNIPFPAVTICNMNQANKKFVDSLVDEKDKLILRSLCRHDDNAVDQNDKASWPQMKRFLINASQPCNKMIEACRFKTANLICDQIFSSVLSDEGMCCTFNVIHPKLMFKNFDPKYHVDEGMEGDADYMTWSPETGYEKTDKKHYPVPAPGPGTKMGLTLTLNADIENYYCSSTRSTGFKVLLHSPIETPKVANYGFFVSPGLETKVVITPKISEASNSIRNIAIKRRQCIFAKEANLSYYEFYSKKNCEMECESKLTEQVCKCTLYYMPRNFNNASNICNRKKAPCYEEVLSNLTNSLFEGLTCNHCLPACFEINYEREISTSKLRIDDKIKAEANETKKSPEEVVDNMAIVHIYFIDNAYGGFTKNELFGFTEFLSNTGGLLGLFMGFSVISLIEIFYFILLRPYCAYKRSKAKAMEDQKVLSKLSSQSTQIYNTGIKSFTNSNHFNDQSNQRDHFMRSDNFKQRQFNDHLPFKLKNGFVYVKSKIANGQVNDSRAPYPYHN